MITLLGYILFLLAGILCGLFGLGGSILIMPVLVYLFDLSIYTATTYCFLIVFISSFIGTCTHIIQNSFKINNVLYCAIPAVLSTIFSRTWIVPVIPEYIQVLHLQVDKDSFIMLMFAIILFFTGMSMWKDKKIQTNKSNNIILVFIGLLVGPVTALLGLGGGFILVPGLVIFNNMNMKVAAASSLFIISLNMLFVLLLEIFILDFTLDVGFMLSLMSLSICGVLIGVYLLHKIDVNLVKKVFSICLLLLSLIIMSIELLY